MINQFINLPTLNFADLDRLFSIISGLDAIKGFFVKNKKIIKFDRNEFDGFTIIKVNYVQSE